MCLSEIDTIVDGANEYLIYAYKIMEDMRNSLRESNAALLKSQEDLEKIVWQLKMAEAEKVSLHNQYVTDIEIGCCVIQVSFDNDLNHMDLLYHNVSISKDIHVEQEVIYRKHVPIGDALTS